MKNALLRYRVMANVVGVLLIVLILVGVPLKYLTEEGTPLQQAGEWITTYLGIAHGWLYMIFLVTAFLLSRKARWSVTTSAPFDPTLSVASPSVREMRSTHMPSSMRPGLGAGPSNPDSTFVTAARVCAP